MRYTDRQNKSNGCENHADCTAKPFFQPKRHHSRVFDDGIRRSDEKSKLVGRPHHREIEPVRVQGTAAGAAVHGLVPGGFPLGLGRKVRPVLFLRHLSQHRHCLSPVPATQKLVGAWRDHPGILPEQRCDPGHRLCQQHLRSRHHGGADDRGNCAAVQRGGCPHPLPHCAP